jgi:flagellar assembly factor FliW
MTKPKFIRADYNTTVEFDLKELDIDWDSKHEVINDDEL